MAPIVSSSYCGESGGHCCTGQWRPCNGASHIRLLLSAERQPYQASLVNRTLVAIVACESGGQAIMAPIVSAPSHRGEWWLLSHLRVAAMQWRGRLTAIVARESGCHAMMLAISCSSWATKADRMARERPVLSTIVADQPELHQKVVAWQSFARMAQSPSPAVSQGLFCKVLSLPTWTHTFFVPSFVSVR